MKIDQNLVWDKHVDHIAKKITSGIGAIRRIKQFVDRNALISVFNALVQPHFNYCSELWDCVSLCQFKRLQKLQNRAARLIMNMPNDANDHEALNALGSSKENVQGSAYDTKLSCGQFTYFSSLQLPLPKTKSLKKSFSYSGAKVWNSLPSTLRECQSLALFKSKIAAHTHSIYNT